jgi:hypothetical protein
MLCDGAEICGHAAICKPVEEFPSILFLRLLPIGADTCFLILVKPVAPRAPLVKIAIGEPNPDLGRRGQKQLRCVRLRRTRKHLRALHPLNLPEISERPRNVGVERNHIPRILLSGNLRICGNGGTPLNRCMRPTTAVRYRLENDSPTFRSTSEISDRFLVHHFPSPRPGFLQRIAAPESWFNVPIPLRLEACLPFHTTGNR